MDFEYHYTAEQERFRKEVQAWLETNIPQKMKAPTDPDDFTEEMYKFWRGKGKELGAKGWLYPMHPKEYGGGGLTPDQAAILHEEFNRVRARVAFTATFVFASLLVWATEEQKQKFLVPLLTGEKVAWQKFTEPKSGSDLASYQSTAVRDGDEWVLNGSNVFVSGMGGSGPDWLYGPMLTDPDAPRHRNLGYFMIPCPSPGVEIRRMNLLSGGDQSFVFLDNVRVSGDHLIGGDHQGWQVANSALEIEHGGEGSIFRSEGPVANVVRFVKERRSKSESSEGDIVLQQRAMEAYIEERMADVMNKRTSWTYHSKQQNGWEGPSTQFFSRESGFRIVGKIRDVMGMYALLGPKDPLAPYGGRMEIHQRGSFIL